MHLPPAIASLLTAAFILFLFWKDIRMQRFVTNSLWIPLLWLTIIGSRFISEWLNMFGFHLGAVDMEDGSPVDAVYFGLLIMSGLYILSQRRVRLSEVVRNNRWLTCYLVYCLISVLWSDFPLVAIKHWLKVLGHPIMVLVVLTEPDPQEAIIRLFKRCAFIWVPISVLFIKYYPEWGRAFDVWTGTGSNAGITMGKNALGLICFIIEVFFFWYLLKTWRMEKGRERRDELLLIAAFLGMNGWLLHVAQSSTSLVSFLIAGAILLLVNQPWMNPRYIGIVLLAAAFMGVVAEEGFGIYSSVIELLGKNPNLTDRTLVWQDLLTVKINPIFGTGFESFWLGDRLNALWAKWWWHPNEAHNAYLETYLNLGLVGLFLLLGVFFTTYKKARRDLLEDIEWGRFRLAFLVGAMFYGWTEAAFRQLDPVYFVLFLIATSYPKALFAKRERATEALIEVQDVKLAPVASWRKVANG